MFYSVDIYYLSNNNILDNIFRVKTYGGKAYLSKNIFAEMTFWMGSKLEKFQGGDIVDLIMFYEFPFTVVCTFSFSFMCKLGSTQCFIWIISKIFQLFYIHKIKWNWRHMIRFRWSIYWLSCLLTQLYHWCIQNFLINVSFIMVVIASRFISSIFILFSFWFILMYFTCYLKRFCIYFDDSKHDHIFR